MKKRIISLIIAWIFSTILFSCSEKTSGEIINTPVSSLTKSTPKNTNSLGVIPSVQFTSTTFPTLTSTESVNGQSLVLTPTPYKPAIIIPDEDFEPSQLETESQAAYNLILRAEMFNTGGVGFGGVITEEEKAYCILRNDPMAIPAFVGLINDASEEGKLFGLLGIYERLYRLDYHLGPYSVSLDEFEDLVEHFYSLTNRDTSISTANGCFFGEISPEEAVSSLKYRAISACISDRFIHYSIDVPPGIR